MAVVETPSFVRDAVSVFTDEERSEMIAFVAANPDAGDIMPDTGGGRKLRWKAAGRGKRGGVRVIYYFYNDSLPLFLLNVFAKNEKVNLSQGVRLSEKDKAMKRSPIKRRKPSAGSRIIASLKEAVDWAEGKNVAVRTTTVQVPTIDVRATRQRLGLSQAAFAAKFGFQPSTLKNWEQGRTRPDGPARILLAVIARHPEAVEDALRKAS